MFFNSFTNRNGYNVDIYEEDVSLHSGIPIQFFGLKNKNFGDWEIPPWELYIFENRVLGEGAFSKGTQPVITIESFPYGGGKGAEGKQLMKKIILGEGYARNLEKVLSTADLDFKIPNKEGKSNSDSVKITLGSASFNISITDTKFISKLD